MRHKVKKHKKFNNKDKNHRNAMIRNLSGQLIRHKKIRKKNPLLVDEIKKQNENNQKRKQ